jgi:hypothetical protein
MNRLVHHTAGMLLAALALAGCGVSGGSSPAQTVPQTSANGVARHVSSTCTPDSYGYCLALVSQEQDFGVCGPHGFQYQIEIDYYQLFHNGASAGFYTYSNNGRSACPPPYLWTPRDPSAATGDPDLP